MFDQFTPKGRILAAALASGLLVRRRLDTLDLVAVLKVRE